MNRLALARAQRAVDQARRGGMFILADEAAGMGELVIPAAAASADAVNLMATRARGLVCLALTAERADTLGLAPQPARGGRVFTTAIEARTGVSTGISAADRARTIAVAVDPAETGAGICTPGHLFPLRAHPGGFAAHPGPVEAALDLCGPQGAVTCAILDEDGAVAGPEALDRLSITLRLPVVSVADVLARRLERDRPYAQIAAGRTRSIWGGDWQVRAYQQPGGAEQRVLWLGARLDPEAPVHVVEGDALADALQLAGAPRLPGVMAEFAAAGQGAVVLLTDEPCPATVAGHLIALAAEEAPPLLRRSA